ncbi:MAG: hypothetical protein IJS24_00890, partial [Eubacterium sp.]|nr:hypothetical protein [Eubacterium sp.]
PTGEAILETGSFTNAEEFRKLILGMIKRHMGNLIAPDDKIKLEDDVKFEMNDNEVKFISDRGMEVTIGFKGDPFVFSKMVDLLSSGFLTKREIISKLCQDQEGIVVSTEFLYHALNRWWNLGFIKCESGRL